MTDKIETGLLLDYYGGMLTGRQQEVLRFYCDMDLSLSEVADEFSITRQAALDLITRGTDKLNKYEEKLGLVNKVRKIRFSLEKTIEDISDEEIKNKLTALLSEIKEI